MITITLPLYISLGKHKAKTWPLNMNEYRRSHFMKIANAKRIYSDIVKCELLATRANGALRGEQIAITYRLYPKRKCDIANILSVVDKFTCDALIQHGIIDDDNIDCLRQITFQFEGVDKTNPRCVAEIRRL